MTASLQNPWLLRNLAQQALDLLFPPRCAGCGRKGALLCAGCRAGAPRLGTPWCARCGEPLNPRARCDRCPAGELRALDWARSAYYFDGAIRQAIHRFKYGGERAFAPVLAAMVAECELDRPLFDAVAPVPLDPLRRRDRGYNQAEDLARALAGHWQLTLALDLRRTRTTRPQVGLDRAARRANVAGAFEWAGDSLGGVKLLLVDDVMTTGATAEACAAALKEAGASFTGIVTVARPVRDGSTDVEAGPPA